MSSAGQETPNSHLKLLPHQIALVDAVLLPEGKRRTLLRADVGLGKSVAFVALLKRLLKQQPAARVLLLVPKALQFQYGDRINEEGISALLVDRYQYREMLDSTTQEEIWPCGVALVLSIDFAKQPDIRDSLANAHWDLVIADEAHTFNGMRGEALRRVGASAERVVLAATATLPNLEWFDAFQGKDVMVVNWRRDQVVGHDGKLLDTTPRPAINELSVTLTPSELSLWTIVLHLCDVLKGISGPESLVPRSILRSLESSPPAIESILRNITERLGAQNGLVPSKIFGEEEEIEEEESDEDQSAPRLLPSAADQISKDAIQALEAIDKLSVDSKLEAFGQLFNHLLQTKGPSPRICVLTDYLATLFYLAADIEGRGMKCLLLHGGMSVDDRKQSLKSFAAAEPILIATRAAMVDDFAFAEVTDVVLYDIPNNKIALEQSLRRFDRFGRKSRLTVHVLVPSNFAGVVAPESLEALRNIFGSNHRLI